MSGLGTKTPVSVLQEYLVLKKITPKYELINNAGQGTHEPKFTIRVQVGDHSEEGTSSSKQKAKHLAAEKMLERLNIVESKTEDKKEINNEPVENYVGQLREHCFNYHYPEPKYYLEEEAGPSHNKTFKMVCCVSQLQEFGISKTKQQAKHQAAFKMIQHLKEFGENKIAQEPQKIVTPSLTNDEIFEKFNALRSTNPVTDKDPAALYKDNHNAYRILQKLSGTLSHTVQEKQAVNVGNALSLLKEISKELGFGLSVQVIPSIVAEVKFTVMTLSCTPSAAGVGESEEGAALDLLNSLIFLCQ